jgi:hypothetical protein
MRSKPKAEVPKTHHTTRHTVFEMWFNTEPIDPADGWTRTPTKGRPIVAIRNCLMSDMSSTRFYKMKPETNTKPISKAEAQRLMKRAPRKLKPKELR